MTEYKDNKIVLRDTQGNQMSLPLFFKLALRNESGTHLCNPSSGLYRNGSTEFHGGWDISANSQTDVLARTPAGGSVVYLGGAGGFGPNLIIIKEDSYNRYHYFGHLASAYVHQGDVVQQGDVVGIIGGYGGHEGSWDPTAYPIHLHYEIMDKNIMVDGGWSTDIDHVLDPMDVFDETTLPANWYFGYDPNYPSRDYAAVNYNWDYIPLDNGAIDFGPPGGETPSEPFFTDKHLYDIGWPQSSDIKRCIDSIVASDAGGMVIEIGYIDGDGFHEFSRWADQNYNAAQAAAYAKTKTAVGVYIYNYAEFGSDTKSAIQQGLTYLTGNGVQPTDLNLGIWLDIDSEGGGDDPYLSNDVETNMINVKDFIDTCNNAGFVCAGIYAPSAVLESSKFRCDYSFNIPIWCAAIGDGNITFDQATYENLMQRFPSFTDYTKMYLYQYSWVQRVSGWSENLDGDRQFFPIPTSGGGGGGGGGGSYTEVIKVTVDVIPPKRLYFTPVPGLIDTESDLLSAREATITITTDADNADIYYTVDGSSPYQYNYNGSTAVYALAANALLYENSITIYKDTHIRAIAVPNNINSGDFFDEPLAKGSGTYLFKYQYLNQDWEQEQQAYATSDGNTSFFEENRQAFLRLHDSLDEEEVLYADVYVHDTQVPEEDAKDNASTTGEATPEIDNVDIGD